MNELGANVTDPGNISYSYQNLCNKFKEILEESQWKSMGIDEQKKYFSKIAEIAKNSPERYKEEFSVLVGGIIYRWVYIKVKNALRGEGGIPKTEEISADIINDIIFNTNAIAKYDCNISAPSTFLQELIENRLKCMAFEGNNTKQTDSARRNEVVSVIEFLKDHNAPVISSSLIYCICEAKRPAAYSYSNIAATFMNPEGLRTTVLNDLTADPKNHFIEVEGNVAVHNFFEEMGKKFGNDFKNTIQWYVERREAGGPRPGEEEKYARAEKKVRLLKSDPVILRTLQTDNVIERRRRKYSVVDNEGRMSKDEINRIANLDV